MAYESLSRFKYPTGKYLSKNTHIIEKFIMWMRTEEYTESLCDLPHITQIVGDSTGTQT